MQSKKESLIEAATNIVAGLVTSFLTQLWIYPFFNIKVSLSQNVYITIIFFAISFVRSYVIRRLFNLKYKNKNQE